MKKIELELISTKISEIIRDLTPNDREEVFQILAEHYCRHCWSNHLPCYCHRDD